MDGRIKAIWIAATNPADSMPRAGKVREALAKCPLVIVADAWPTDTTALAHIVLPAAGWAEKDGTVTNSERRISRQRAFRAAPGQARPDWWMFTEVARRMGWETGLRLSGPRRHVSVNMPRLSAFENAPENNGARAFNLGGLAEIDDAAFDALPPLQWPVPKHGGGAERLFARGGFSTPDRKARMLALSPRPDEERAQFALTLNTGRIRDQWHTMTRTGLVPNLMTHIAAPTIALHPRDAAARGIADRGLARVENEHGAIVIRAALDEGVRPGDVFGAMHWTDQFSSSGPIDRLVHAVTDPVSGQPDLKGTTVRVTAVAEAWRGNLLRRSGDAPALSEALWWAKATLEAGYAFEMAGWNPLAQEIRSEATLRKLLGIGPEVELVSYSDPRKSMFRYAGIAHGELQACVFFGPAGADFTGVEQAKALLGKPISPMERIALLAGLEGSGAKKTGRIICACFGVDESIIAAAINEGCNSPTQIGAACKAGTNCGSCIPELKKLLRANAPALNAAE